MLFLLNLGKEPSLSVRICSISSACCVIWIILEILITPIKVIRITSSALIAVITNLRRSFFTIGRTSLYKVTETLRYNQEISWME